MTEVSERSDVHFALWVDLRESFRPYSRGPVIEKKESDSPSEVSSLWVTKLSRISMHVTSQFDA